MRIKLGLQEHDRSHFFDLQFISINIFSTELFGLYSLKSFEGISSPTNSIMPPAELFLPSRNRELKASIANCLHGKDESTFVRRSAKCLIYPEQFLVAFQICFLKNLYSSDR